MPDLSKPFSSVRLAKAITSKRTGMKLTLVDVSQALNISKPTLIKIEKGDVNVQFFNVLKVMEYLGLSFSLVSDDESHHNNKDEVSDEQWY
ncbi:helix-turn-helix transcriptional regulator [Pseudoalteromonas sp. NZS71]|jgi:transcriptional regulator with XRE-family HTH domain|nr:helix-turn-helix transcriptional regulator [Pseudoalteromonas sp. SG45-3]MBB1359133.1 helix-turn-helix transcriptional regulator [Pseudoalteromonas sp. SG45-6]MBH0001205.1 helix-turn-helix transcriptional regulator [Pseudoalteromonas sp. SWYJZ12]MBH0015948.1 helix-turn-helix transcriptional regulator [Pseudoalteromonas sp. NGC95]MBH0032187.1 helix-turn-helix transcriptional regulator [Pseudoalteromonas sp. SWYJZ98]MBH0061882.1 helix-turn-helix transcriptional regulator [Pseudoalteromonas sp